MWAEFKAVAWWSGYDGVLASHFRVPGLASLFLIQFPANSQMMGQVLGNKPLRWEMSAVVHVWLGYWEYLESGPEHGRKISASLPSK